MNPIAKKILFTIAMAFMVLLICLDLKKNYEKEVEAAFDVMIPSIPNRNFTFFSGDKDVTSNVNFPTTISLELKPGDRFLGTFVAKNHERNTKTFNLSVDKFKNAENNDFSLISKSSEIPVLKFLHNENFDLQKEAMEIIKYTISIPENPEEGEYNSVVSLILEKSSADKKENSFIKFRPAIGISMKIRVSKKPNYHQYSPIITKEPYEIAGKKIIAQAIKIGTALLAILSLFFFVRHFKK